MLRSTLRTTRSYCIQYVSFGALSPLPQWTCNPIDYPPPPHFSAHLTRDSIGVGKNETTRLFFSNVKTPISPNICNYHNHRWEHYINRCVVVLKTVTYSEFCTFFVLFFRNWWKWVPPKPGRSRRVSFGSEHNKRKRACVSSSALRHTSAVR